MPISIEIKFYLDSTNPSSSFSSERIRKKNKKNKLNKD